jgi:hypothetical protein
VDVRPSLDAVLNIFPVLGCHGPNRLTAYEVRLAEIPSSLRSPVEFPIQWRWPGRTTIVVWRRRRAGSVAL